VYIGDPANTVRILNDKNIPELILLDIGSTTNKQEPAYTLISKIAAECSVPLTYGGGIRTLESARKVFDCGIEKICLNTAAYQTPQLISEIASIYGTQSVVVCADVRKDKKGVYEVYISNGRKNTRITAGKYATKMEQLGCGELILQLIDHDGTFAGYDEVLVNQISAMVNIPIIACGGATNVDNMHKILSYGASAAAAGSIFLFSGKHKAVLVSYPFQAHL